VLRGILALSVGLEAVGTAGYGVYLAVESVLAPSVDRAGAVVLAATAIALGLLLAVGVRAVTAGRAGVRMPLVVWQLMQLSVAYLTVGTRWVVLGAVLAVVSVAVVVTAFWPGVLGVSGVDGVEG
jgi:hypothetical protein